MTKLKQSLDAVVTPIDSSKKSLTKRQLSIIDKSSLVSKDQRALVLLGLGAPEVQELVDFGFSLDQITGVDYDKDMADQASRQYPGLDVRYVRLNVFLAACYPSKFSYMHLDYCGNITQYRVQEIKMASRMIVPTGRLRVTFLFDNADKRFKPSEFSTRFKYAYQMVDHIANVVRPRFDPPTTYLYDSERDNSRMLTFWLDRRQVDDRQDIRLGRTN